MRWNIRGKLIAFTLCVILFVGGSISFFSTYLGHKEIVRSFEKKALSITTTFTKSLVNDLYFLDIASLNRELRELQINPEIRYAYVMDAKGTIISRSVTKDSHRDRMIFDSFSQLILQSRDWIIREEGDSLKVGGPIRMPDGAKIGFLQIDFSLAEVNLISNHYIQLNIILTALFLVIGSLLAVFLSLSFTRPIEQIVAASEKIGNGDLETRIHSNRKDELGALTHSINQMAKSLNQKTVSKEYVSDIIESMIDTVIVLDAKGYIVSANQASLDLLGYKEEAILGQHFDVLLNANASLTHPDIIHLIKEGVIGHLEMEYVSRTGKIIPVAFSGSVQTDVKNKVIGMACVAQDITQRNQTIQKLQQTMEEADAANRAKCEFISNMSHELRTPMNGIIASADILKDTNLDKDQTDLMEILRKSANDLLKLMDNILDFSNIEAGKLVFESMHFSLKKCLQDSVRSIEENARKKGLRICCETAKDVPDSIIGDPVRLRQLVHNLLDNAVKFTEEGEICLKVEVDSWQAENKLHLHFMVIDTGLGISEEHQTNIFDSFTQVDGSLTRKYGGIGLGLSLSSRLVDLMEGKIWLESKVQEGSTFHFTINVKTDKSHGDKTDWEETATENMPVLIISNNEKNQKSLKDLFSHWQMKPLVVSDIQTAKIAMDEAKKNRKDFALAIFDFHFTEQDGFTLAKSIDEHNKNTNPPFMYLTLATKKCDTNRRGEMGVSAYFNKLAKHAELLNAVKAIVEKQLKVDKSKTLFNRYSLKPDKKAMNILLVEDNELNQAVVVSMLENNGYNVVVAENGKIAVNYLEKGLFDVVLMDIQMPEMDGFEATKIIRLKEKESGKLHMPIIAITAHTLKENRDKCFKVGMNDFLCKPVHPEQLLEAIESQVM